MGRKQQLKARALARARDGSVPVSAGPQRGHGSAKTEGPGPRALSFEPDSTPKDPYDPRRGSSADVPPTDANNRTGRKRAATTEDRTDVITEDGEPSQEPAPKRARTSTYITDNSILHNQNPAQASNSTASATGTSWSSRDRMMSEPASWLNTPEPRERKPDAATHESTSNTHQQRFPNADRDPGLRRSTSELKPLLQHAPSRAAAEAAVTAAATAAAAAATDTTAQAVAAPIHAVASRPALSMTSSPAIPNPPRPSSNFSKLWKKGKGKMRPVTIGATLYTPIAQADSSQKTKMLNFIGVIVSYRVPTKSHYGSGDFTMNLNIVDPGCFTSDDRLSINLFGLTKESLPGHATEGTVILLRNVKMSLFNGKMVGTVFKDKMAWCTLSVDAEFPAVVRTNTGMTVHQPERDHMHDMSIWYRETYLSPPTADNDTTGLARVGAMGESSGAGAPGPSTGEDSRQAAAAVAAAVTHHLKRTITLDQLEDNMFCHCVAEVVRVFDQTDRPEIYVTDWTSHPQLDAVNNRDIGWAQEDLDRLEEQRGDSGGGSVLKVTLWDEQANAATSLQPGSFIHLRNMRCKRSALGMFEGAVGGCRTLRESKENKWQIQKLKQSDPLLKALSQRKAKVLEDLEMERAMSWPEPGSSAEKAREQVATPPAGASGNAQPSESVSVSAATHSGSIAEKEDTNESVKALPAAQTESTVESRSEAAQGKEVTAEASEAESGEKPGRGRTEKMAVDPRDQTTQDGEHDEDVEMHPFRLDKSQHRDQASQQSTILSLPLSDTTNSTSSGTPSLLYSLPPPGQQATAGRPVPSSSYPSTNSQYVHMEAPFSSTPMLNLRLGEDGDDSSQLENCEAVATELTKEAKRRANQERANEMLACKAARWKLFTMNMISDGQGLGAKHHVRGRIVDVMPRQICRWVKVKCDLCKQELPETDNFCAPCADEEGTHLSYEWQFAVYLHDEGEEESATVPVVISGEHAETFLPGLDPAQHRRDVKAQRRLRKRLRPIFGDVIEDPDLWPGPLDPTTDDVKLPQSTADTSTNPIIDLGVYAFEVMQEKPQKKQKKRTRSASGPERIIRCKLFGTVLALK